MFTTYAQLRSGSRKPEACPWKVDTKQASPLTGFLAKIAAANKAERLSSPGFQGRGMSPVRAQSPIRAQAPSVFGQRVQSPYASGNARAISPAAARSTASRSPLAQTRNSTVVLQYDFDGNGWFGNSGRSPWNISVQTDRNDSTLVDRCAHETIQEAGRSGWLIDSTAFQQRTICKQVLLRSGRTVQIQVSSKDGGRIVDLLAHKLSTAL